MFVQRNNQWEKEGEEGKRESERREKKERQREREIINRKIFIIRYVITSCDFGG